MKKIMNYVAAAVASVLLAGNAHSAIILVDSQDGSGGSPYTGWDDSAFGGFGLPASPTINDGGGSGVPIAGQQAITIQGDTSDFAVRGILLSTPAFAGPTVNYGGSGSDVNALTFDFYADGTVPSLLGFYFQSVGGSHWFYNIASVGAANTWNTYEVGVASSGWLGYDNIDWTGAPGETIDAAWANIAEVGMYFWFNPNQAGQDYALADYGVGMTVPEPETYVVLGMALLSVAFIFRKRITDSLAEARAMMQM